MGAPTTLLLESHSSARLCPRDPVAYAAIEREVRVQSAGNYRRDGRERVSFRGGTRRITGNDDPAHLENCLVHLGRVLFESFKVSLQSVQAMKRTRGGYGLHED